MAVRRQKKFPVRLYNRSFYIRIDAGRDFRMLKLTLTENTELIDNREKCLTWLRTHKVDVGLTSSASGRSVFLLGIHTRGSPIMRIPPRPVVQPALAQESLKSEMGEKMKAACEAAFEGDQDGVITGMEAAGQRGADGIREYIDAGIDPPNSPVTLSGGWIWNRAAKKGVLVSGKNGSTPMKDTEQLYNDFDWEITGR